MGGRDADRRKANDGEQRVVEDMLTSDEAGLLLIFCYVPLAFSVPCCILCFVHFASGERKAVCRSGSSYFESVDLPSPAPPALSHT